MVDQERTGLRYLLVKLLRKYFMFLLMEFISFFPTLLRLLVIQGNRCFHSCMLLHDLQIFLIQNGHWKPVNHSSTASLFLAMSHTSDMIYLYRKPVIVFSAKKSVSLYEQLCSYLNSVQALCQICLTCFVSFMW